MVSLDSSVVARLDYHGERFELFVDPNLAYLYKQGHKINLSDILAVEEVFKNARKAERHSVDTIKKVFGTEDIFQIASKIIKEGEISLTTEQRAKLLEEKTKKIVNIISRECIDPRTSAPHPPQRIEKAMKEAKVSVDIFKEPEAQIDNIINALRLVLPLKFEKTKIAVRVPPEFAQKAYGTLKEYHIKKEEWGDDGSLIALIELPVGLQGDFYNRINKITGGKAETKLIK